MTHEEVKLICEAKKLAENAGMFVVQKQDRFILYRRCNPKNVRLGGRKSVKDFRRYVERVASPKATS